MLKPSDDFYDFLLFFSIISHLLTSVSINYITSTITNISSLPTLINEPNSELGYTGRRYQTPWSLGDVEKSIPPFPTTNARPTLP
jgi:hypothetical protein